MKIRTVATHTAAGGVGAGAAAIAALFLMAHEGYEPKAVHERADPPAVITWCHGRTNFDDPSVKIGTAFSKDDCAKFLKADIPKYAAPLQSCMPHFNEWPDELQASLISFGYNIGSERACTSTVAKQLNAGHYSAGCNAMLAWNRVNGHVCDSKHCGLGQRRRDEQKLCLAGADKIAEAAQVKHCQANPAAPDCFNRHDGHP